MALRGGFPAEKASEGFEVEHKNSDAAVATGSSSSRDDTEGKTTTILEDGVPNYLPEDDFFGKAEVVSAPKGMSLGNRRGVPRTY